MFSAKGLVLIRFTCLVLVLSACTGSSNDDVNGSGSGSGGGGNGNYGNSYTDANFDVIMGTNQIYMAPNGINSGDCSSELTPCLTFAYAISHMSPGDGLILLDGNYDSSINGELRTTNDDGSAVPNVAASAQLPTGIDVNNPTIVRALNPGEVFIEGGFMLGTKFTKIEYVIVYGLTFFQRSSFRNVDNSVLKATGVYGGLGVGSSDHIMGTRFNLIEDVWIWGKNVRGNLTNFVANNNLYRRVLIRDDGCDTIHCGDGAGNATIGSTVYSSNNVRFENVITIDRILRANTWGGAETNYADFATAQHGDKALGTPGGELQGYNQWLGCMAINSEDNALNFEADNVMDTPVTTVSIRDFVALNTRGGVSMDGARRAYSGVSKHDIDGMHIRAWASSAFHRGCVNMYSGDPGCNVHVPVSPVSTGAVTEAPYSIGQSSLLPQKQYGTNTDLWPWPYELRIHNDICVRGNFAGIGDEFPNTGIRAVKNFCSYNGSLTDYIMSF